MRGPWHRAGDSGLGFRVLGFRGSGFKGLGFKVLLIRRAVPS